jgi:hypothetical protein
MHSWLPLPVAQAAAEGLKQQTVVRRDSGMDESVGRDVNLRISVLMCLMIASGAGFLMVATSGFYQTSAYSQSITRQDGIN